MSNQDYLKEIVEKDLSEYGQSNPCPMSLTIVEGKYWRHYELGAIFGFVVYNKPENLEKDWWGIASIREDDEYWFISNSPMNISAFWVEAIDKTWKRMVQWTKKHLREGWLSDDCISSPSQYKRIIIDPIIPEIIPWPENEEPDNAVLGTKFSIINK